MGKEIWIYFERINKFWKSSIRSSLIQSYGSYKDAKLFFDAQKLQY